MKKVIIFILAIVLLTSCSTTRRDCQGVKHTKQKGGFYL